MFHLSFSGKQWFWFIILACVMMVVLPLQFINARGRQADSNNSTIADRQVLSFDMEKRQIVGPSDRVQDLLHLQLISVSVDQPQYWPNEKVHLKVALPGEPNQSVKITLRDNQGSTTQLGTHPLNSHGLLHLVVMDGEAKKLKLGEYKVDAELINRSHDLSGTASFEIYEGELGAFSFANPFQRLTSASELKSSRGGWYLGNAAGAGMRWGNGLNFRNELRINNQPYNGKVQIKSYCWLPGCNGCPGGPSIEVNVADGIVEGCMEVGGHSGPFEIEVIADEGSFRYMFEGSGHVERKMTVLSQGMTHLFRAGLAPYSGTTAIPGRQIFVETVKNQNASPVALQSVIADVQSNVDIQLEKNVESMQIVIWEPEMDGSFQSRTVYSRQPSFRKGDTIRLKITGPYSLITLGGFIKDEEKPFEGYAIVFTQSQIQVEIELPTAGGPLSEQELMLITKDTISKQGLPVSGFLEIFDNRVASRSAIRPLTSKIGDSFRSTSDQLSDWYDSTGIFVDNRRNSNELMMDEVEEDGFCLNGSSPQPSMMRTTAVTGGYAGYGASYNNNQLEQTEVIPESDEQIREGEKKVIFCDVVTTDIYGQAHVPFTLPPQTGRLVARFTVFNGMDHAWLEESMDVKKASSVEAQIPKLLVEGAKIKAVAYVTNETSGPVTLNIFAGQKKHSFFIRSGFHEVQFDLDDSCIGQVIMEIANASGRILDNRTYEIQGLSSQPVILTKLVLSQNERYQIKEGETVTVYSQPGHLLKDMIMTMQTTIHSWFAHGEALTAALAAKATMYRSIYENIIPNNGQALNIKSDLETGVRHLKEVYFVASKNLFAPYPGMEADPLWSAWMTSNLSKMQSTLEGNPQLASVFRDTLTEVDALIEAVNPNLLAMNENWAVKIGYNPESPRQEGIAIPLGDEMVYYVLTDDAVINWIYDKFVPAIDFESPQPGLSLKEQQRNLDIYRLMRVFERTGHLPYLIKCAKALWLDDKGQSKEFFQLFNKIARDSVLTQEAGLIQGPALLGGIYSGPQTVVQFLDLLLLMSESGSAGHLSNRRMLQVKTDNRTNEVDISQSPFQIQNLDGSAIEVQLPSFAMMHIAKEAIVDFQDSARQESFATVELETNQLSIGQSGLIRIELQEERNATEYFALIAIPSTVSIKQTDDILSDYTGQLLFGQRQTGGQKIRYISVPFRGAHHIDLIVDGVYEGTSPGQVLIRHINNQEDTCVVKIPSIQVTKS